MAVTYGFYNSVGGDRTYDAKQFGAIFTGIITDGVFELIGDALTVVAASGMTVTVGDGRAWFNGTWTKNDADLVLNVSTSHISLPRIDTVVLEIDESDGVRANTIKIVDGTAAASPVPPTLTNTAEVHQYPLAYISVVAGETNLTMGDITDLVGTASTPFVTVPQAGSAGGAAVLETQVYS